MRAILLASMVRGRSFVSGVLESPDTRAMITACRSLGARIIEDDGGLSIEGVAGCPGAPSEVIDAGNSGQVLRFIAAVAALSDGRTIITGDQSIRHNRPVKPLLDGLRQLGASAVSEGGDDRPPLIVKGPLRAGVASIDGADSQPVSALLIAAAFVEGTSHIRVQNPGEIPWIGMTLEWLNRLGVEVENHASIAYQVHGGAVPPAFDYKVPGDFSSMAFPVTAALLTGGELTLENVDMNDTQGDKQLLQVLIKMGADISTDATKGSLKVKPGRPLKGFIGDVNDYIDALPVLAVAGCFAEGETRLLNCAIARKKESDRLATITSELRKMGADIDEANDCLTIRPAKLKGAEVCAHRDHRIAMALGVAAFGADGITRLRGGECVEKSYPGFWSEMSRLGAEIEVVQ
jgi:3-phosphoshikimate 1-carboxyvinyltransferase